MSVFSEYGRSLGLLTTAGAWRRFSVLRLRQKNGAKRMLWSGSLINLANILIISTHYFELIQSMERTFSSVKIAAIVSDITVESVSFFKVFLSPKQIR